MKLFQVAGSLIALSGALFCGPAYGQESCSIGSVIQPAIDAAATDGSCIADGVYIDASTFPDQAQEECVPLNPGRCRKCVLESTSRGLGVLKALVRAKLLEQSAIAESREAFKAVKAECRSSEPNPEPSGSPSPQPSPEPGGLAKAHTVVVDNCPCEHHFTNHQAFVQCVGNVLNYAVSHNIISQAAAYAEHHRASESNCSRN